MQHGEAIPPDSPQGPYQVFENFCSTSGVHFELHDGWLFMQYRHPVDDMTDEQAIAYAQSTNPTAYAIAEAKGTTEDIVEKARRAKAGENIGGSAGITDRSLKQVEEELPGVEQKLYRATGKVVFLGNGLSSAPLELLAAHDNDAPEIVVADCYDYEAFRDDMIRLHDALEAAGYMQYSASLEGKIQRCNALLEAANARLITLVVHVLGDDEVPEPMRDAEVVVNCEGPPITTLGAQLSCLKPGGQLYLNNGTVTTSTSIVVSNIFIGKYHISTIVTKNA